MESTENENELHPDAIALAELIYDIYQEDKKTS